MGSDAAVDQFLLVARGMVDAVRRVDPSRAVPTTPGWTVRDLVHHTGDVHRWAGAMVATLAPTFLDRRTMDMDHPADDAGLADWLAASAEGAAQALRAADPDAPMWAWGADQHVRFWPRRLVHETTVHAADLALAAGDDPVGIDAAWAVDGIDEFLENLPRAARFSPTMRGLGGEGSLHLHATDAEGEWMVFLEPEGFRWEHGHGKGSVAVRGPAPELLLLVYGRRPADHPAFERFGDDAVLAHWLAHTALG
jgi:uncharacterized protein (TIGR03083 family)